MPLSGTVAKPRIVELVQAIRRHPDAPYAVAIGLVALATLARWAMGDYGGGEIPFITFFPAIIIATLIGGLWPGVCAIILSVLSAWYLFIPPAFSFELGSRELVQLLWFILFCGINLAIVVAVNALVDRVMAQEQDMRTLLECAPAGVVVVDEEGSIKLVNASTEKLFGYKRSELLEKNIETLVPARLADMHKAERKMFVQKAQARRMGAGRDLTGRRKDGSEFPVEIDLNPVSHDGTSGVLATIIDVSERKRAQQSQQRLFSELDYKTRNLFAVFEAIAGLTADQSETVADVKYALNGRLQALARAYAMLARGTSEGLSLATIINQQVASLLERVRISGCDVSLSPQAAHQFALIIHELATNALKYGALSNLQGSIAIEGRIEPFNGDSHFIFSWKEHGGPPVSPPARIGFGSVILLESAREFGRVAMDYAQEGVTYELDVPLGAIVASARSQTTSAPARASSAPAP